MHSVISARQSQTQDGSGEESSKNQSFFRLKFRPYQRVDGQTDKCDTANEMGPNVASFSMDSEQRLKACCKGWQWRSVAPNQVIIVLKPVRQSLKVANFPRSFYHFATNISSLFCHSTSSSSHVGTKLCSSMESIFQL